MNKLFFGIIVFLAFFAFFSLMVAMPPIVIKKTVVSDVNFQVVNDVNNANFLNGLSSGAFVKKSGDTMTGDLTLESAITEKPILTLQNTTLGGDTPFLNITNVNGTLSLYLNPDGTGVIDGSGGIPLYLGNPSEFSSGGGGTSNLGSLTDKWKNLFLSEDATINGNLTVDEDVTAKNYVNSSLMGWYRFQVDGTDYSYLLRNLTGGTYTSGFLTGGATGNSYASLYNAEANVTVVSKFKIDDPTQSGSTVFELYKNTGHLGATNTAWYLGANNDRFTGVYDQMVFLIENNGTPIVAWNSGGNYNDKVWHSIEVTCGAGGSVFRIDGAIVTGTYATGNASTACGFNAITSPDRIQIGNTKASIADMKIFNRVLTTRETLKEYDEMLLNPFYSSLSNLGAIGFNGATNANYFMELTYSALDAPGRPKGILHYANPQEGSNGGSQVFFDLSTYRMDFSGNIYYKGVMTDGAGGNYPAYFSNINDSSESTWNNSALYLSANNAGGTGQELAAYAARGNYFAVDNYGLLLGTGFDAKIVYDGTNLVINPKLVGTGSTIILGDLNTTKDINASGVFWSGKARGINKTITYMASAIISCQMDINGGIITKITGAGC